MPNIQQLAEKYYLINILIHIFWVYLSAFG